jgi:cytochrome c
MTGRIGTFVVHVLVSGAAAALILLAAADVGQAQEEGQVEFNNHCRTCHSVQEGDHRLGPSLHNIIGREAGSQEGPAYSGAMQASRIVWDEETLDRFIEDPDAVVPGNNMTPFAGIPDADVRAAIVGYLQAESGG